MRLNKIRTSAEYILYLRVLLKYFDTLYFLIMCKFNILSIQNKIKIKSDKISEIEFSKILLKILFDKI